MFGVVLWSNEAEQKAVIWCEDHGDLAYYRPSDADTGLSLDVGDLIQFEMCTDHQIRFAQNPRVVSEAVCANLADALVESAATRPVKADQIRSAQIIPFDRKAPSDTSVARPGRAHHA